MEKLTVEKEIWIDAPPERVWQAVTDDKQLMRWWGDHWEIPVLEKGTEIKFGEPGDLMTATIERLDPPREFAIRWPPQPQYHSTEIFTIFLLEEEKGGTRVKVSETGFEALPEDVRQKRFESTAKGYETVLAGLKKHVETITVERGIWIDAPIERVWAAVTDPARLGEWYAPGSPWKIPVLETGAVVEFLHSPNPHHTATEVTVLKATIVKLDPPREFSLEWEPDETYSGMVLTTSFHLAEENGGTRATIGESGYEAVPADEREKWLDSISSGYALSMENLKAVVEGREAPHR